MPRRTAAAISSSTSARPSRRSREARTVCGSRSDRFAGGDQDVESADVGAFGEIERKKPLDELILLAGPASQGDQLVGGDRVGRPCDPVEVELGPFLGAEHHERPVRLLQGVEGAELPPHVVGPRHAALRNRGVELEGPPAHLNLGVAQRGDGAGEPALAEKAPRAHDVRIDVDRNGRAPFHHSVAHVVVASKPGKGWVSGRPILVQRAIHWPPAS